MYTIGVRISSAIVLLLFAFRTAWPAFAYSIEDDAEAKLTYAFVLTYLVLLACWLASALGVLAPWIVRILLERSPATSGPARRVGLLAFGTPLRTRRTPSWRSASAARGGRSSTG